MAGPSPAQTYRAPSFSTRPSDSTCSTASGYPRPPPPDRCHRRRHGWLRGRSRRVRVLLCSRRCGLGCLLTRSLCCGSLAVQLRRQLLALTLRKLGLALINQAQRLCSAYAHQAQPTRASRRAAVIACALLCVVYALSRGRVSFQLRGYLLQPAWPAWIAASFMTFATCSSAATFCILTFAGAEKELSVACLVSTVRSPSAER